MSRRMRRKTAWSGMALILLTAAVWPTISRAAEATSELTEVTLYRDQAQIIRTVAVPKGEGPIELVVAGLPPQILANSLFAQGGPEIDVRAVRYRERVVSEEPREEIRELDARIQAKQIELGAIDEMLWLVKKRFEYLDKLDEFSAPTATAELSKGVLDAKQLRETAQFIFEQRELATQKKLDQEADQRTVKKEIQTLQHKRALAAGKSQSVIREAVLFLDRRDATANAVQLTYLVNNCGWSPSYNVRGELGNSKVRVEYNALIRQMTGEDWSDIKLTLSTASPMISASGPAMAGFPVSLKQLSKGGRGINGFDLNDALSNTSSGGKSKVAEDYKGLLQAQASNITRFNQSDNNKDNFDIAWSNNVIANDRQLIELCEPIDKLAPMGLVKSPEQGLSISYTIDGKVSLQSRADQQMTRIMQSELEGDFYHVANPVLTQLVYREAEVVNTSGRDLLTGPVNVYLDGAFVGRTEMVSVTRGQTFVLGFGADPQLNATRQLVKREQSQQGGNTLLAFDYRLAVENFGTQAAQVRLFDRLPNFRNEDDVKLTLVSGFDDLSTDPVYLRIDRPDGVLRWDITVQPGATGEKAAVKPYRYTLEFDRNFGLSSEVDESLKQQFESEQLDRKRF